MSPEAAFDLYAELSALVAALERDGIDYALCGGVALAVHGAPRATQDIDLLVPPGQIDRLRDVAQGQGFIFEAPPLEFASTGLVIRRFTKLIGAQPLMLDALLVGGANESAWKSRMTVPFEGGMLRVVSREGLIALKVTAGRPQDIADVQRLQEIGRG